MKVFPRDSNSTVSQATFVRRLTAGVLLINLLVITLAGLSLRQSRHQFEERAAVTTQNLAQVLEQYIGGSLHKIDVVLLTASDEIEKQIDGGRINRGKLNGILVRHSARLPELDGMRMANARGEIAYGKGVAVGDLKSVADRDYFIRLRNDANAGLIISKPLVSRVIGKWALILARRVNRPDGSFAGVVYGVIPLEHFLKVFTSIDVGKHGAITLRDGELAVIVRYPEPPGTVGRKGVSAKLRELINSGRDIGTYNALTPVDETERTYTYLKLSGYPLYITVGLATKDYLAEWRREVAIMSAVVALFILFTIIASRRFLHDWKRQKADVQALMKQEIKYRTLFEESKDTILISDPAGRLLDVNQAGIELFGYTREELVSLDPVTLYCNPEDRKLLWQKLLISGSVNNFEVEMKRKDGEKITVDLSVAITRDDEGKVLGHRGIVRDMTESKRLERQLLQAQKMESIGQLAGGVAHDFNNLLTAISGYGQILQDSISADDEISRESVEQVLKAADRAAELTRSLLAFSRKQMIHPKPVMVDSIIRGTDKFIRRVIGEDIELKTSFPDEKLPVFADAGQIEQVLMNLATNARDAMPQGGRLNISAQEEVIREGSEGRYELAKPGKYARISVSDTGAGIDEKFLGKIFEPFFTTKEVGKGTGLGLAMIYGAIKQHNGSILVKSEPGKGTTFNIYLPILNAANQGEEKEPAIAESSSTGSETLLVAEDEEIVRSFMKKILERAGYKVIVAADGEEAVEKFGENKEDISLILSDVIMPKKNGREILEVARRIKPSIKVVFISGYTANVMLEKGIFEEGVDFITKPFLKDKLLRKVREVLDEG
jgi:PAS domain S-box-containing protein